MKEKTILAQNIQTLRQKKGWTQEVLSSMCKLSAGAIIDYENSRREPCGAALVALEQAFGVTGGAAVRAGAAASSRGHRAADPAA